MSARNPGRAARGRLADRTPGMRRGHTQTVESWAVRHVNNVVEDDLKWNFGCASLPDYGADALAEIVNDDDRVTGGLIGFQIKGGGSWFERAKGDKGWTFKESNDHLAYWLGYSVPIVVVMVNNDKEAFWQVVSTKTVTEHKKTFTMLIPRSQRFDGTARDALGALVRRYGGLIQELPAYYPVLPAAAVRPLRRAEGTDQLGAARLAERLASGRAQPGRTVSYLLDMQPSWLARSAATQDLWLAAGAYAEQHGFRAEAGKAFAEAADSDGPQSPIASAAAGLALLFHDRAAARDHALRARDGGMVMLADMCLSQLEIPEGDGRPADIPPSIAAASAEELDASPNVMSFLADIYSRRGDLTDAVRFAERALRGAGNQDGAVRLQLATLINRRAAARDLSVRDYRRAVSLAGEVVEERRRWDGPSAEALALLVDLYIRGDTTAALRAALPAAEGGTARDTELDCPGVAFGGGTAALLTGNETAYRFFLGRLPDGSYRRELLAVECAVTGQPADRQIQARLDVLRDPADEPMAGRCVAALARLGHWPSEADELHDRHVLPDDTYEILRAIWRFRTGERDIGLARLSELSDVSAMAALELVGLVAEHHGAVQAIEECERQVTRWQAPELAVKLVDLHGRSENFGRAEELVRHVVSDASFADDIRVGLCNWYVARKGNQGDFSEAAAFAARGLEIRDDPDLAWNLVRALFNDGKIIKARQALARYQPDPVAEDETSLWLQLHLGVPLTPGDARTMTGIAQRLPDGDLRVATIGLLVREVLLTPPSSGTQFPEDIAGAVAELRDQADGRPGGLELDSADDETLRAALRDSQPDPAAFQILIRDVLGGRKSHADIARFVHRPYAAVLLQRPAGVIPAIDLRPGLRAAGERAAEQAIAGRSCVADLSSLHLLCLLGDDDRLRIRSKLPDLLAARSAVTDTVLARDQMRGLGISTYTVALRPDGTIERTILTATQQAVLRDQAEALEAITSSLQTRTPAARQDAAVDGIAIAREGSLPLWCDDIALRQRARVRGVPAFSLLDLVTVLARHGTLVTMSAILRGLAGEYVADLPLDAADIIAVAATTSWDIGPAHTALARPAWWEHHARDWADAWLQISTRSREHSATAFIGITKAALAGAIASVTTSLRTKRYQEVTVLALVACHIAGQPAPLGLLDQLAAFTGPALAPRPEYILQALERELGNRSVPDPYSHARLLLHGVDNGTE